MAVTLKRKRVAVSYREPSSDDDALDSAVDAGLSRKRAAPVRRSARHRSTGTDQPCPRQDRVSPTQPATPSTTANSRHRPRRGVNGPVSYRDASSEDEDRVEDKEEDDFEVEAEPMLVLHRRPARTDAAPAKGKNRSSERGSRRRPGRSPRKALGAPLKRRKSPKPVPGSANVPTDGHRPVWSNLPYHVLLQIFVYAAHPLHDENMVPTPSIGWLVQVARMCSAFTKPALTALYRNPPIFATRGTRNELVQGLTNPSTDTYVDYRVMVKRLELDAIQMASSTDPLHDTADLAALIAALTTVKEVDIFDPFDRPPYRPRTKRVRQWRYPDELFDTLSQSRVRLHSWRWNSSFCTKGFDWFKEIHEAMTFQSLHELTLTKFAPNKIRKVDDDASESATEALLGEALAALPELRHLTFESCEMVNERLLPLLPVTLRSLTLTNCIYLMSDALHDFLESQGQQLEVLVLNNNQSLNLSFMVDLKRFCPKLEVFRMDLNYYSSLAMSSDNEPLYDFLIDVDEIPTWPSSLRVIDMEYLRNWTSTAATNFFTSLIDSAKDLPALRELRILAMVDIDWRQRADFRRQWAARFVKVFSRRFVAPSPHLMSLRAYREWKLSASDSATKNDSLLEISEEVKSHGDEGSDSDAPLVRRGKPKADERWTSKRLRARGQESAHYEETSDSGSGTEEAADAEEEEPDHIQGLCHTVVFRIDNLRPREDLYDEGDFLDEERSGDEDWDGNDVDDDRYAW